MQWFYIQNEKRIGPIEETDLFQLASNGKLSPQDLVWNPSMGEEWKPASSISGLFTPPAVIPPSTGTGNTPNRRLMEKAIRSLSGNWAIAVGLALLFQIIISSVQVVPYLGALFALLINGPMLFGLNRFFLKIARGTATEVGDLFDGFKWYGKTLGGYALMALFLGLWSLLLIIPGVFAAITIPAATQSSDAAMVVLLPLIILFFILMALPVIRASLSYSMLFFILSDQPELGPYEALQRSAQMMMGYKWKKFCLGWRFFGWGVLALCTCGIGFLWLFPYMTTTNAHFYEDVRNLVEK